MLGPCAVFLSLVVAIRPEMEPFIVGGALASIRRYPHSAFLTVACAMLDGKKTTWICGSSIINQYILLTAGHCVYSCNVGTHISINVGDENRTSGMVRSAGGFILHEKYDTMTSDYDIALIKVVRPFKFNSKVSRVALMRKPPYGEVAYLAGWGLTNEKLFLQGYVLKQVDQRVWKHADCVKLFGTVPRATICASSKKPIDFAAQGDSGSALVVRGYIQIGLVSYKIPHVANNVIIYTDVGLYYDWINLNAKRLYCVVTL